jgi:hypothetical protein
MGFCDQVVKHYSEYKVVERSTALGNDGLIEN